MNRPDPTFIGTGRGKSLLLIPVILLAHLKAELEEKELTAVGTSGAVVSCLISLRGLTKSCMLCVPLYKWTLKVVDYGQLESGIAGRLHLCFQAVAVIAGQLYTSYA